MSIMFKEICTNEEMLPKINIYIYTVGIIGKVDKSNACNGFRSNISIFINKTTSSD